MTDVRDNDGNPEEGIQLANSTRDPRAYELMTILIPDMPEEDTQAAIERIRGYISDANATVSEVLTDSPWGRRRLAYTMRFNSVDYRDGFYALTYFSATPDVLTEIERELKLDTQVIRYLLVSDDPKAGEKPGLQGEDEAGQAESETAAEAATPAQAAAPAQAEETAPAAEGASTDEAPAEQGAATEEASAEEAAPVAEQVEETAAEIEGEEEPAPADAPADAPAARRSSKLPTEGEGQEWVAGDGTDTVPDGFPIKGNASSKIYHPEESPNYSNTIAEIYFANGEAAERHGYRLPKTLQNAGAAAAGSVADLARKAANAASEEE